MSLSVWHQVGARSGTREQTDDGSPFGVQLRSRGTSKPSPAPSAGSRGGADVSKAEFQGFKLRKTPSQTSQEKPSQKDREAEGWVSVVYPSCVCVGCGCGGH